MLLSEMVRRIADEQVLHDDASTYSRTGTYNWTTVVSKTVTLTKQAIVYISFTTERLTSTSYGAGRVLLGDTPIASSGAAEAGVPFTRVCWILLDPGTYTFNFQLSCFQTSYSTDGMKVSGIKIIAFNFPDKSKVSYSGSANVAPGATATIINQNFTLPTARRTVAGRLKRIPIFLFAYLTAGSRVSVVKNPGESDDSDRVNWKILINDTQVSWTERANDRGTSSSNLTYGAGAYGLYAYPFDAGSTINIKINATNTSTTTTYTCTAYIAILACPWLIPAIEYEPIALEFPQGSTLYIVAEPLQTDPTKTIKLGRRRGISFGDTTDYYSTATGAGILMWNYTFESVEVSSCTLLVAGYGGCISIIAVDVRG